MRLKSTRPTVVSNDPTSAFSAVVFIVVPGTREQLDLGVNFNLVQL